MEPGDEPRRRLVPNGIKKSPNFSIEAVFEEIYFKPVLVHVNLFKLVNVDVYAIMFHERG